MGRVTPNHFREEIIWCEISMLKVTATPELCAMSTTYFCVKENEVGDEFISPSIWVVPQDYTLVPFLGREFLFFTECSVFYATMLLLIYKYIIL